MIQTITKDLIYKKSEPFNFSDSDPIEIFTNLKETMIENKLFGLSANMIGIPKQVFVMGDWQSPDQILCIFNPKIVYYSDETDILMEGCSGLPNYFAKIKRSKTIRFRAWNYEKHFSTQTFTGLSSRIFQHEYDHLNGITIKKRASLYYKMKEKVKTNGNFIL